MLAAGQGVRHEENITARAELKQTLPGGMVRGRAPARRLDLNGWQGSQSPPLRQLPPVHILVGLPNELIDAARGGS